MCDCLIHQEKYAIVKFNLMCVFFLTWCHSTKWSTFESWILHYMQSSLGHSSPPTIIYLESSLLTPDWVGWIRERENISNLNQGLPWGSDLQRSMTFLWESEEQGATVLRDDNLLDRMGQEHGLHSFPSLVLVPLQLWPFWPCSFSWFLFAYGTRWQKWISMACRSALPTSPGTSPALLLYLLHDIWVLHPHCLPWIPQPVRATITSFKWDLHNVRAKSLFICSHILNYHWWLRMLSVEQDCLGSNPSSFIYQLCDPGHVVMPLFPGFLIVKWM